MCIHQTSPELDLGVLAPTIARSFSFSLSSNQSVPVAISTKKCKSVHVSPQKKMKKGTCQSLLTSPAVAEEEEVGERAPSFPEMALLVWPKTRSGIAVADAKKIGLGILIGDGSGCGGNGGRGGGGDGDGDGGGGGDDDYWGRESLDGYYQKMIRKYPEDALLLGNYARFLKEVKLINTLWKFKGSVWKIFNVKMFSFCLFIYLILFIRNMMDWIERFCHAYRYEVMLLKRKNTVRERFWLSQLMGMFYLCMEI